MQGVTPASYVPVLCLQEKDKLHPLMQQINALGRGQSTSYVNEEPDPNDILLAILQRMENPNFVLWAPRYGAAAILHDTPRPCPITEIHVIGLDGWEKHQHRCVEVLHELCACTYHATSQTGNEPGPLHLPVQQVCC
jgi:hypothetical protein